MWEEFSSWNERFAKLLNGCQNSVSDRSHKHMEKKCKACPERHHADAFGSLVLVASVAVIVLIIKVIVGFYAIEDNSQDVLFPKERNGLLDRFARRVSRFYYQKTGIGMLL